MARWIAITDTHGDMCEPGVLSVVRDFCKVWKPTVRLHLGDLWDFRWLRRGASDEEKAEAVSADFEAGIELVDWYKPTVFLWGNHDYRLVRLLDSTSGSCRHLAGQWLDRIGVVLAGVEQRPYGKRKGIYRYGDYTFVHGYARGMGAARKHALTYGNVMFGDLHTVDLVPVEGPERRVGHCIGCCCRLEMDYNAGHINTLRQCHGFAYGEEHDGRLTVWQAKEVDGRWILPTETRTFNSSPKRCNPSASAAARRA